MQYEERILWTKIPAHITPATTTVNQQFWRYFKSGDQLLEVGCGWGRILKRCLKKGFRVAGIDINKNEIIALQKEIKNCRLHDFVQVRYGNILTINFNNQKFDGILLQGVLSALREKERTICLKNVNKFLISGGYIHIAEFTLDMSCKKRYENDFKITGEYGTLSVRDVKRAEVFRSHNFFKIELLDLIKKNGFNIVHFDKTVFKSYHGHKKPGMTIIARKID
jgi:cyclopropane fatty-acyl-phospholipid synthase-like methyltransferase